VIREGGRAEYSLGMACGVMRRLDKSPNGQPEEWVQGAGDETTSNKIQSIRADIILTKDHGGETLVTA